MTKATSETSVMGSQGFVALRLSAQRWARRDGHDIIARLPNLPKHGAKLLISRKLVELLADETGWLHTGPFLRPLIPVFCKTRFR